MFSNWTRKREKKKLQSQCPHEWHTVRERRECGEYDCWDEADVYCPLCESVQDVSLGVAKRLIKQTEIRKQYADDFRI